MNTIPMRRSHLVSNAGNRPFSPRFTAAVMVKEIVCKTPGRSSPEDYAVGYLLHSVPGLEARFSEAGQPLTKVICQHQVKTKQGQPGPGRGGKTPTDLNLLKMGSSQVSRHVTWQTIIFENARIESRDPTGQNLPTLKATYLTAGPSAQDRGLLASQPNAQPIKTKDTLFYPTLVMPRKDTGTGRAYQKVALADPYNAVTITNEDELRAAIAQRISATPMGYPGFLLVSRQIAPGNYTREEAVNFAREPSTRDASICLLSPYAVDTYGRRMEPGSNAQLAGYQPGTLEDGLAAIRPEHRQHSLFHPGWQHTLVPLMGFPQSLFAYDKVHDPSKHYQFDQQGYGFAQSVVVIQEAQNGSGGWVSSFQKPVNSCGDIVSPEEIVTADMPEYHRLAAEEMVRANTAERLQRAAEAAAQYQNRHSSPGTQPAQGYDPGFAPPQYSREAYQPQSQWGPADGQYAPQYQPQYPQGSRGPQGQQHPTGGHNGRPQDYQQPNPPQRGQAPIGDPHGGWGAPQYDPRYVAPQQHNGPDRRQAPAPQQPLPPQRGAGAPQRQPMQPQQQGRGQGQGRWVDRGPQDTYDVDW